MDGSACVFSPPSTFGQVGCRSTFFERALDEYCHSADVCQSGLCAVSVSEDEEGPTLGVCMAPAENCEVECGPEWVCATRPVMGETPHCARIVESEP